MGLPQSLINLILHLDQSLAFLVNAFGPWTYLILFLVIFCETGIIVTAFLPGDSLLFATGTLAASLPDVLSIHLLFVLLLCASIAGNTVNYLTGKWIGPQIFRNSNSLLFNPKHLSRAHQFCERYGNMAIVLARFMPVIRTFAPFVAGVGYMTYRRFLMFNLLGAFIWIGGLLYGSYLFGNIPWVQAHFGAVILAIIAFSVFPGVLGVANTLIRYR